MPQRAGSWAEAELHAWQVARGFKGSIADLVRARQINEGHRNLSAMEKASCFLKQIRGPGVTSYITWLCRGFRYGPVGNARRSKKSPPSAKVSSFTIL